MDGRPAVVLSQQDQLRCRIGTAPDNGILFKLVPKAFGRFKPESQYEETGLTVPVAAWVLAYTREEAQALIRERLGQSRLAH